MFLSVDRGSARVSYSDLKVENIKDHWSQRLFDTNTDTVLNQNERMELQNMLQLQLICWVMVVVVVDPWTYV